MRRLTGILLALSLLHVSARDLRAECERHAALEAVAGEHAGHDMASMAHDDEQPPRQAESPPPKCCMMAGTCASATFATMRTDGVVLTAFDRALVAPGSRLTAGPSRAPDPPPPKA
jgi:hypothetical protein